MFYQASLQVFVNFNKCLQREDLIIPVICDQINGFLKSQFAWFVSVAAVRRAKTDISTVQCSRENQVPDTSLFIGIITRQALNRLLEAGDITAAQVKIFYEVAWCFYCTAAEYALANLPINSSVLKNTRLVDFDKRESAEFSQVEFFVARYPGLLPYESAAQIKKLKEEYLEYQLLGSC